MTAITINIPNHEVSFFKKMIAKMGWTYSEADVVRSAATPKEQALAKVDHAFGQLRQMKDGQLQGINAEDLLNSSRVRWPFSYSSIIIILLIAIDHILYRQMLKQWV